jgi:hypothetical protein
MEEPMKNYLVHHLTAAALVSVATAMTGALVADAQTDPVEETTTAGGVASKLDLTPAQRIAIYQETHKDNSKVAPRRFAANVGADVPPMIELYTLPDGVIADNSVTKLYKYTRVDDQVVLVDPLHMRVVAVIGPKAGE